MAKKKKTLEELLEEALVPVEEQSYDVPGNWVWTKLGKITTINPPKMKTNNIDDEQVCSFIPMNVIDEKTGKIKEAENRPLKKVKKGYTNFLEGDILFAKITPCMENGKSSLAENLLNGFGYGSTEFYVIRHSNVTNKKYIYYLVRSYEFRQQAKYKMQGAVGHLRVPKQFMEGYPVALPTLNEQERIVSRIESLFFKLDRAKELIEEAREDFDNRKAAILAKAFRGELTEKWRKQHDDVESAEDLLKRLYEKKEMITGKKVKGSEVVEVAYELPEKWEWVKTQDISSLITKGSSPKWQGINYVEDDSQVLFITSENIRDGYVDLRKEKYLELEFNNKQKRSILEYGDVLLNIVGASIGRAAIFKLNKIANINQAVSIIRLVNKSMNKYLNYYLNAPTAKGYYMQSKVDVARANLSLKDVCNIPIPLPPLEEQKEIVRILDKLLEEESRIEELTQLEEQIELIKKSILGKGFRGELGTNDPEEESALELLKEVLEEKCK